MRKTAADAQMLMQDAKKQLADQRSQNQAMEWEKVRMSWSKDATKPGHGMGEGTYVVV